MVPMVSTLERFHCISIIRPVDFREIYSPVFNCIHQRSLTPFCMGFCMYFKGNLPKDGDSAVKELFEIINTKSEVHIEKFIIR